MPLVITKSSHVQYIATKELLQELLWHSDFDGEDWAIGDRLIFENGTESRIVAAHDSHDWEEPTMADLEEVKRSVRAIQAADWNELFAAFEAKLEASTKRSGCFGNAILLLLVSVAVLQAGLTTGCSGCV